MRLTLWRSAVGLSVLALASSLTTAQERTIQRDALPPAVEQTVAREAAGATVRGFSMEKEHGQTFYEAELTVDGHFKDILIDAQGAVVEVEEQVAFDALPERVRVGILAKAGKGKVGVVESLRKHDKLVAYEAHVASAGKRWEVQVDPDGKPLAHEE